MAGQFETEDFKELKQKEKTDLFLLLFFIIMTYFSLGQLSSVVDYKTKIIYAQENVKAYSAAVYGEIYKNDLEATYKKTPEQLITEIDNFKNELSKKALLFNDLNNWKYVEFFINYHLNKIGQNGIQLGGNRASFVNFSENQITVEVTTNKSEDITYLLTEFNKAGYLNGFTIKKENGLYTTNIKLKFIIN